MEQQKTGRVFKFDELILHVATRYEDDDTFGSVKLNKVLYYSDFTAYRDLGQPITGATYQKLPAGPVPVEWHSQCPKLVRDGAARIERVPFFTGVQKRLVAQRSPDLELFSPDERDLIDRIIKFFEGWTGREISDFSHKEPGGYWQTTEKQYPTKQLG